MDGRSVQAKLQLIKTGMPETYAAIQAKAGEIGNQAYAMVRRSLGGQANVFWACEGGHVVGTPFGAEQPIAQDVAAAMVNFGARRVVIWGDVGAAADGAH